MADQNLGNLTWTVGVKGVDGVQRDLQKIEREIKGATGQRSIQSLGTSASAKVGAVVEKLVVDRINGASKALAAAVSSGNQAAQAAIQKQLSLLKSIDPRQGAAAVGSAKVLGGSADFVSAIQSAVDHVSRSMAKSIASSIKQQADKAVAVASQSSLAIGEVDRQYHSAMRAIEAGQARFKSKYSKQLKGGLPGVEPISSQVDIIRLNKKSEQRLYGSEEEFNRKLDQIDRIRKRLEAREQSRRIDSLIGNQTELSTGYSVSPLPAGKRRPQGKEHFDFGEGVFSDASLLPEEAVIAAKAVAMRLRSQRSAAAESLGGKSAKFSRAEYKRSVAESIKKSIEEDEEALQSQKEYLLLEEKKRKDLEDLARIDRLRSMLRNRAVDVPASIVKSIDDDLESQKERYRIGKKIEAIKKSSMSDDDKVFAAAQVHRTEDVRNQIAKELSKSTGPGDGDTYGIQGQYELEGSRGTNYVDPFAGGKSRASKIKPRRDVIQDDALIEIMGDANRREYEWEMDQKNREEKARVRAKLEKLREKDEIAARTHRGFSPFDGFSSYRERDPWLKSVHESMTKPGHFFLGERAEEGRRLSSSIGRQVSENDINIEISKQLARVNVAKVQQSAIAQGKTISNPLDLATEQNKLIALEERSLRIISASQDINQQVNYMLGERVSYTQKVADLEQSITNQMKQQLGLSESQNLSQDQKDEARRRAKHLADREQLPEYLTKYDKAEDESDARIRATEDYMRRQDAEIAAARAKYAPGSRERDLAELRYEKEFRDARNVMADEKELKRNLQEQREHQDRISRAAAQKREGSGFGHFLKTYGIGVRSYDQDIEREERAMKQKEQMTTNAGRRQASQRARANQYRNMELSYGVQDFMQVLSGGGGLDAALRASANNVSQFFAAAGGANAARNAGLASVAVLGISAAYKIYQDRLERVKKSQDDVNESMRRNFELMREIGQQASRSIVSTNDYSGAGIVDQSNMIADLSSRIAFQRGTEIPGLANSASMMLPTGLMSDFSLFKDKAMGLLQRQLSTYGDLLDAASRLDIGGLWNSSVKFATGGLLGKETTSDRIINDEASEGYVARAFRQRFYEGDSTASVIENNQSSSAKINRIVRDIANAKQDQLDEIVDQLKREKLTGAFEEKEFQALEKATRELRENRERLAMAEKAQAIAHEQFVANLAYRNDRASGLSFQSRMGTAGSDFAGMREGFGRAAGLRRLADQSNDARVKADLLKQADAEDVRARELMRSAIKGYSADYKEQGAMSYESATQPYSMAVKDAEETLKVKGDVSKADADALAEVQRKRQELNRQDNANELDEARKQKEKLLRQAAVNRRDEQAEKDRGSAFASFYGKQAEKYETMAMGVDSRIKALEGLIEEENNLAKQEAELAKKVADGVITQQEANEALKKTKEALNQASRDAIAGFSVGSRRQYESDAEYRDRVSKSFEQARANIEKQNLDPADKKARLAQLERVRQIEQMSDREKKAFDRASLAARAYGNQFDEQRVDAGRRFADEMRKNDIEFGDSPEGQARRAAIIKANSRDLDRINSRDQFSRFDRQNPMADRIASFVGGREGQKYQAMKDLQSDLARIRDQQLAEGYSDNWRREEEGKAKMLYDENLKQIEEKRVGFSDVGSLWKNIQMSLKPDKSIQLQEQIKSDMSKLREKIVEGSLSVELKVPA